MIGVGALVLCVIGGFFNPEQFFRSYLFAYLFWIGVSLGSMAIFMLHQLTGGRWGAVIRRFLESATRTIPLLAMLFIPVLFGIRHIYIWTHEHDEILRHKEIYLNIPFFIIRAVLYFGIWGGMSFFLNKWSLEQDRNATPSVAQRMQVLSGPGLVLYGLTMTFAAIDWIMSLEPHWFSTIYGLMIMTGQVLSAFAMVVIFCAMFREQEPLSGVLEPSHFKDLGNLILTFVMLWAYLSYSQLLLIWAGNLREEIPWYVHRLKTNWEWLGVILLLFHFAFPFVLLLSRGIKRNYRLLAMIAAGLIIVRFLDLFWLVKPEFHQTGFAIHYLDVLLLIALGGIWLAYFLYQLKSRPMVPLHDPNLMEAHGTRA